jgi:hypothetical protein
MPKTKYTYSVVRTDEYFFEIEANSGAEADEKFDKMNTDPEAKEWTAKKNLDISHSLEKAELVEDEDDYEE